ncbi:hypothetical protein [Flavobacterium psychraquaticum]|uniref:hypothetical protein n=1 Tax=Flavobacterium psychraquaticum TaxID=3103958 RepID=UPI002ACD9EA9|nr:hypothetical protein [Flavobacterium sp. LB-N7T]
MKINYNKTENSIEIKDELKNHYFMLMVVMILNLINAIIRLTKFTKSEFGIEEFFWLAIGIISLISLYLYFFKRSTAEKIKVDEIKKLTEKNVFGNKRFSLDLKNGKRRILGSFNENEIIELRLLLTDIGVLK